MLDTANTPYLDAARRSNENSQHNMVAPGPPQPPSHDDANNATSENVALVSTEPTAHNMPTNPYKIWDGDNSTLAPFLSEFDIHHSVPSGTGEARRGHSESAATCKTVVTCSGR
jgi:hypothetical protein